MWRSRKLLIPLALLAILAAATFALTHDREPTYAGHSLSYWLEAPRSSESERAVQAIGTNAFPFILRWMRHETPPWRKNYAAIAKKYRYYHAYRVLYGREREKAILGFAMLATKVTPPIPALRNMMRDRAHPDAAYDATFALAFLGQQGLPFLAEALSDPDAGLRSNVVRAITSSVRSGALTNAGLLALLSATTDPDPGVRRAATNATRHIDPEALSPTPH